MRIGSRLFPGLTLASLAAIGLVAWSLFHPPKSESSRGKLAANETPPSRVPDAPPSLKDGVDVAPRVSSGAATEPKSPPAATRIPSPWSELRTQASSPERNAALCALIEAFAARHPAEATALALAEPDAALREQLLQATLHGWATADVEAAGRWALAQNHLHRDLALPAVFNGARARPEDAILFAQTISREQPNRAQDFGNYVLFALARADEHEKAVAFATAPNVEQGRVWITAAYADWGRRQPEAALASAARLTDPAKRQIAFRASAAGWAKVDPQKLAEHASTLPPGEERDFALVTALRAWAQKDPDSAASYLTRVGSLPRAELILED
jgi:hypothetical protein